VRLRLVYSGTIFVLGFEKMIARRRDIKRVGPTILYCYRTVQCDGIGRP